MAISADNEWSPLRSVIVGIAAGSCFSDEPSQMVEATMPEEHWAKFSGSQPFPPDILRQADQELDTLAEILRRENITVLRPQKVDWQEHRGYTGAMPRDGLLTVGNTIIEAPFAWRSRSNEICLGFSKILKDLSKDPAVVVARVPEKQQPAFDAADFMRFGKTILGQLSHVTNSKGVEYLRSKIPPGYSIELLQTSDSSAMHIDATILPLREGLLVYHPARVTEQELRKHSVLADWEIHAYPFVPAPRASPPLYMTSPWIAMNLLVLDGKKVLVEAQDTELAEWLRGRGMTPIPCPFRHVHSIGGSFHCATVDLVREG